MRAFKNSRDIVPDLQQAGLVSYSYNLWNSRRVSFKNNVF